MWFSQGRRIAHNHSAFFIVESEEECCARSARSCEGFEGAGVAILKLIRFKSTILVAQHPSTALRPVLQEHGITRVTYVEYQQLFFVRIHRTTPLRTGTVSRRRGMPQNGQRVDTCAGAAPPS